MTTTTDNLQYPVGKFQRPDTFNAKDIPTYIDTIESFPVNLRNAINDLSPAQRLKPYREGGWNALQVVHHCADSHMNSFIRFKLGLTENNPTIKPYAEAKWAEMSDYTNADIQYSLQILDGLHARWTILLKSMQEEDFHKTIFHPQQQREMTLFVLLALYAWHCNHHLAHVLSIK